MRFRQAARSSHSAQDGDGHITTTRYNYRHYGGHSAMSFDFSGKRVAVLGAGKMGGILLKALLEKGLLSPKSTFATVQHEERARALAEKLGVSVGTDNL